MKHLIMAFVYAFVCVGWCITHFHSQSVPDTVVAFLLLSLGVFRIYLYGREAK